MPRQNDTTLLQMALVGYEAERRNIKGKIAEIQRRLKGRSGRADTVGAPAPTGPGRKMSAAARKRIAAAQKKRWAEYRKQRT